MISTIIMCSLQIVAFISIYRAGKCGGRKEIYQEQIEKYKELRAQYDHNLEDMRDIYNAIYQKQEDRITFLTSACKCKENID